MPGNIALPRALQARLEKAAARTNASTESLVRQAIAAHLDYLDWREKAIRAGSELLAIELKKDSRPRFPLSLNRACPID